MVSSQSWGPLGKIGANIALDSWLFRFWPFQDYSIYGKCSNLEQHQNKVNFKMMIGVLGRIDRKLLNVIFAQILPIEPQDQHKHIHKVLVNSSGMILRFYG